MILFVPVTRFRVNYSLAQGLPYSHLDGLLLEAIETGLTSLEKLIDNFHLHPRLLVQSLVTLAQTGWVALGSSPEEQFILTPSGVHALTNNDLPPFREITSRFAYVLMECVNGMVVLENQVQYVRKWQLERDGYWDKNACLKPEVFRNTLDSSDVYDLLPRQQGQRLHFVGPVELVSKSSEFLLVDVNPEQDIILNLPPRLGKNLKSDLITKARELKNRQEYNEEIKRYTKGKGDHIEGAVQQSEWVVEWSPESLLTTVEQHNKLLTRVFEQADSVIYIATSIIDVQTLENLKSDILGALNRGITIYLLRGYSGDQESLDWMKKVAYDAAQSELPGKLYFNKELAPSNVKMMLWNEDKVFYGIIGSNDWLSSYSQEEKPLSVMISHPCLFESLARCASSLWKTSKSEHLSSVPDRWDNIAIDVAKQTSNIMINNDEKVDLTEMTKMRVIFNYEVPILLKEWSQGKMQVQLFVISESLDMEGISHYCSLFESGQLNSDIQFLTLYGQSSLSEQQIAEISSEVSTMLGVKKGNSNIIGNVVLCDTSACISSSSFLLQPPREDQIRQAAIVIEGSKPASQIAEYIIHLTENVP
ncbi:MAG: hypothetical protein ABFD18_09255 [Syntrophomonas sp.]